MDSPSQYKDIDVTPQASMNLFKKFCIAILCVFIVLFAATMTGVWYLLLLSVIDAGDCSSFGGYPCSPWTKVINLLKPYCTMEHMGLPPVWSIRCCLSRSFYVSTISPQSFQFVCLIKNKICDNWQHTFSNPINLVRLFEYNKPGIPSITLQWKKLKEN